MGVSERYKKTEIGILPNDWLCVDAADAMDFRGGYSFKSSDAKKSGVRWLKIANVGKSKILWDEESFLPSEFLSQHLDFRLHVGDVVMALTRPILNGELKVAKLVESDSPALLNQRVASILNKDISDKTYIYYALQTPRFVNSMSDAMAGSDPPNIGVKTLEKLKIPLPATKFEQEAIAKALSDADAYIESLDKLIEKKRLIKKGVMQELLTGARRLPGFKEKWNATSCSELIMEMIDNRGKTPPLSNIGFSLLEANAIKDGYRSPDLSKVGKFVDQNVFTNWFRDGHPKVGDILLVTVGSAGVSCLIDKEIVCIAQNIIAVRLKKMVDPKYFYYFTQTEKFKKQVAAVLMGAVQPSLKVPHLMKFEINIPSTKEEQTEIGNLIWDIDSYICEQEQKLTKARQIKQGMMQELLTGRIRLV